MISLPVGYVGWILVAQTMNGGIVAIMPQASQTYCNKAEIEYRLKNPNHMTTCMYREPAK